MERINFLDDVKQYGKLAADTYKLKFIRSLSTSISSVLSIVLVIAILQLVLISLAIAIVLLLGKVIGDYVLSALIVGGFFILLLLIVIACRKRLFAGTFIKTLLNDTDIKSAEGIDKQLMLNEVELAKREYEIKRDVDYIMDWKRYVNPIVQIVSQLLHKGSQEEKPSGQSPE